MKTCFLPLAMLLFSPLLQAQEATGYQCVLDEVTRRVEVFYETGSTVPCEVQYFKDTEMPGERQILWRAQSEEGYCEARAAEFVEQLRGTGWTCWAAGDPEAGDEADDTDALAPAEQEIEITEAETPSSN